MPPFRRLSLLRILGFTAALAVAAGCGAHPNGAGPRPLTEEERTLLSLGMLPTNYPELVAAESTNGADAARVLDRTGATGPFSEDYGDPEAELDTARFSRRHPEFTRFMGFVKRGDLVFISPNDPNNFVAKMTGGPFSHVMICTDAGVPGRFIEAVGVTGVKGDPVLDRVRRTTGASLANETVTLRVLRPDGATAEARERAVAFAEAQLGKPYNYTFSDSLAGDRGYYCSSLAYRAYQAAGIPLVPKKDPARDRLVEAFSFPVLSLKPDDALGITAHVMMTLHQIPGPTGEAFASTLVNDVLPHCKRTASLLARPSERQHVERALAHLLSGKPFPRYSADATEYRAYVAAAHVPVVGCLHKAGLEARMVVDFSHDTADLLGVADVNAFGAVGALSAMLGAMVPYLDVFCAYLTGPHSPETRAAQELLEGLDALRPLAPFWPEAVLGPNVLTGHAALRPDSDFVSPTDLAWADVPHEDFNLVQPAAIAAPWPYAVVPESGRFFKL